MLDFVLVLGHVPGTNIDLTFYELVFGVPALLILFYLNRRLQVISRLRQGFNIIGSHLRVSHLRHRSPVKV